MNRLFWYFQDYFCDATLPSMENLFLLVLSMLALDCFHSVRFAWLHLISRFTNKSLNSFYYTLEHGTFDHSRWPLVSARRALSVIPSSCKGNAVFLSIDDTMVEKFGLKFQACSNLFDHAAHNDSCYLNGHCFVSIMLHVPVMGSGGAFYLSVPLGYRMWVKDSGKSKLTLAAELVRSVMPVFAAGQQVILLCDSWYPKGVVLTLTNEFPQLEMICNVRCDTALYDLPAPRTGKRGRPRIRGERLELRDLQLTKPEGSKYYLASRKIITNLWKGQPVYLYVTASAPEKESSYRLFLCTINPDDIRTGPELESGKKFREYRQWGMLPLGLYSLRWNIETSYYETKTFWSFCAYRVRSMIGIERLVNLVCISYAAVHLLPHYSCEFAQYQGMSSQEIRYQIGEKIRMNLIIVNLEQYIETMKNNKLVKEALKAYAHSQGYQ